MNQISKTRVNASWITASIVGAFGGILGFEHGIGEILHGNSTITSILINAYKAPGLPFPIGVEPAMTIIPNYLLTGILAVIMGLIVMIWSVFFIQKKYSSIILYLFSILLLLVGGGFVPIMVLIIAGIAGFKIRSSFKFWKKTPAGFRRFLAILWPWFIIAYFVMMLILITWGYSTGMNNPEFDLNTFVSLSAISGLIQLGLMILALIASMAHDSLKDIR